MNRDSMLISFCIPVEQWRCICTRRVGCLRYSQTELNGTARYLGMGGALAHWAEIFRPCRLIRQVQGIYRSSEIVTTLSLSSIKAKSDWGRSKVDANKTKFNFDNIAYVGYFPTGNDEGLIGWNIGFSYNRVKISIVIIVCVALKITHWLIMQQLRRLMPERIGIAVNGLVFQRK